MTHGRLARIYDVPQDASLEDIRKMADLLIRLREEARASGLPTHPSFGTGISTKLVADIIDEWK